MGYFATVNPIPTPTLPLKGRELATIALKLVPFHPDTHYCRHLTGKWNAGLGHMLTCL